MNNSKKRNRSEISKKFHEKIRLRNEAFEAASHVKLSIEDVDKIIAEMKAESSQGGTEGSHRRKFILPPGDVVSVTCTYYVVKNGHLWWMGGGMRKIRDIREELIEAGYHHSD